MVERCISKANHETYFGVLRLESFELQAASLCRVGRFQLVKLPVAGTGWRESKEVGTGLGLVDGIVGHKTMQCGSVSARIPFVNWGRTRIDTAKGPRYSGPVAPSSSGK